MQEEAQNWRDSQTVEKKEAEGGEGQASRMLHAFPEAVIYLHTD